MWGLPETPYRYRGGNIYMELTAEQDAKFKELCKDIKPGEYGKVEVSFIGNPSNVVQIIGEKTHRFHNEKKERVT
jgi:hypothetical protein